MESIFFGSCRKTAVTRIDIDYLVGSDFLSVIGIPLTLAALVLVTQGHDCFDKKYYIYL
jgi:hypothetical protein